MGFPDCVRDFGTTELVTREMAGLVTREMSGLITTGMVGLITLYKRDWLVVTYQCSEATVLATRETKEAVAMCSTKLGRVHTMGLVGYQGETEPVTRDTVTA